MCCVSCENFEIGKILNYVKKSKLKNNTTIIYTSDHGDALGMRGMWGKSTMFEESAGIPMIIKGPNIPKSKKIKTSIKMWNISRSIRSNK